MNESIEARGSRALGSPNAMSIEPRHAVKCWHKCPPKQIHRWPSRRQMHTCYCAVASIVVPSLE
eukprot:scaffold1625_cov192-Alexandrium_tamarense.AAC.48